MLPSCTSTTGLTFLQRIVYFHNRTNVFAEGRGRKRWVPFPPSRPRLRNAGVGVFLFY